MFAGGWVLFHKGGAEARRKINLKEEVVRSSCATFSRPAFVRQEEEECFP